MADGRSHDELIEAARAVAPGSGGATFVPDLRGRLSPETDPRARGALFGLRADHDRPALFRAVLEGLAMDTRQTLDVLQDAIGSGPPSEIRVVGGGTRNALLLELKATLYGQRILASEMSEASALGAALLGGLAAGLYGSLNQATGALDLSFRSIDPEPGLSEVYERHLTEVYRPACRVLRPLDRSLAELYD